MLARHLRHPPRLQAVVTWPSSERQQTETVPLLKARIRLCSFPFRTQQRLHLVSRSVPMMILQTLLHRFPHRCSIQMELPRLLICFLFLLRSLFGYIIVERTASITAFTHTTTVRYSSSRSTGRIVEATPQIQMVVAQKRLPPFDARFPRHGS